MGEEVSKIEYFFSRAYTIFFWNFEQYPIPNSADLKSDDFRLIYPNIVSALHKMGFHGSVEIQAYGENPNDTGELYDAGIKYMGLEDMTLDIITCAAASCPETPLNIVVIAKQNLQIADPELERVLWCLKSRKYTVLLVQPPHGTTPDRLFHSVESIVACTQVLGGGKPKTKPKESHDDDDDADFNGVF